MNDICKMKKTLLIDKPHQHTKIFTTENNQIIKSIKMQKNREKPFALILQEKLKKTKAQIFFVNYTKIQKCGNFNCYLMPRYAYDVNASFLQKLTPQQQFNLLQQGVFALFYLNNILHVYHNDVYFRQSIRNFMADPITQTYTVNQGDIEVLAHDFLLKIIDLGQSKNYPSFRTTQYYEKYFPQLKYKSEAFLFIFFFLTTIYPENIELYQTVLQKYAAVILKECKKDLF